MMRKYFVAGLALLLPVTLTIIIVLFMVNLLTEPFLGAVSGIMEHYGIFSNGFWFLSGSQIQNYISKILILATLFFFTVLLGLLARQVVFYYFLKTGDYILHRIPFVSTLYKTFQDVFNTIFAAKTTSFKQVVMVPFPSEISYSLGLVTRDNIPGKDGEVRIAVFVPTTPNPTSGFMLLCREEDVTFLDISVEEALKYVISCGVILTPFSKMSREEALARIHELERLEGIGE